MILRVKDPSLMMRIGLIFLIVANASNWFFQRTAYLNPGVADGLIGFLFGVSIACLVLGMVIARRRSNGK